MIEIHMTDEQLVRFVYDTLVRDGWVQGHYHDAGSHCMLGAARLAMDETGEWVSYYRVMNRLGVLVRASIADLFGDRLGTPEDLESCEPEELVGVFNDHPDTTFEDVTLVLKHSIERLNDATF